MQLFQLRLSPEQSGKVECEHERLLGIANKFIHLLVIPSSLRAHSRLFRFARGAILIEIAVLMSMLIYCIHTKIQYAADILYIPKSSIHINAHAEHAHILYKPKSTMFMSMLISKPQTKIFKSMLMSMLIYNPKRACSRVYWMRT
jgi:hypothetical protein